tara:strand:+ start:1308 stop:2060 length:753 start_codon:yes stop_codon:yes gene_type:complete
MEFVRKIMTALKEAKKLKITVTNLRSVLIKRTKRLANLKKINSRDQNNLFSIQRRRSREKRLESPLKSITKKIVSPIKKIVPKLNIGKVVGLLFTGVAVNAIMNNMDKITEGANNLKEKADSWFGGNKSKLNKMEKELDNIDTNKLQNMSDKFFNNSKLLDEELSKFQGERSRIKESSQEENKRRLEKTFQMGVLTPGGISKKEKEKAGKIFDTDMIVPENEDVSSGLMDSKLFAQRDTTLVFLNQPIEV